MWIPDMNEIILAGALAHYKVKYGYTTNTSIDTDKLNDIIKEMEDAEKEKRNIRKKTRKKSG